MKDSNVMERQIRADFQRGLAIQNSEAENLFNQLREHFGGLKEKLVVTQRKVSDAESTGVA